MSEVRRTEEKDGCTEYIQRSYGRTVVSAEADPLIPLSAPTGAPHRCLGYQSVRNSLTTYSVLRKYQISA